MHPSRSGGDVLHAQIVLAYATRSPVTPGKVRPRPARAVVLLVVAGNAPLIHGVAVATEYED